MPAPDTYIHARAHLPEGKEKERERKKANEARRRRSGTGERGIEIKELY
jgi:hypothetical protein